jgi:hypothetical protein
VRVGEVDLQPGGLLDPLVMEHLVALVPGQCPAQGWRQCCERADQGIADGPGGVIRGQRDQHGEPGLALDQGRDR